MIKEVIDSKRRLVAINNKSLASIASASETQIGKFINDDISLNNKSIQKCFEHLNINLSLYDNRLKLAFRVAKKLIEMYSTNDKSSIDTSKEVLNNLLKLQQEALYKKTEEKGIMHLLPVHNKEDYEDIANEGIVDIEGTYPFFQVMTMHIAFLLLQTKVTDEVKVTNITFSAAQLEESYNNVLLVLNNDDYETVAIRRLKISTELSIEAAKSIAINNNDSFINEYCKFLAIESNLDADIFKKVYDKLFLIFDNIIENNVLNEKYRTEKDFIKAIIKTLQAEFSSELYNTQEWKNLLAVVIDKVKAEKTDALNEEECLLLENTVKVLQKISFTTSSTLLIYSEIHPGNIDRYKKTIGEEIYKASLKKIDNQEDGNFYKEFIDNYVELLANPISSLFSKLEDEQTTTFHDYKSYNMLFCLGREVVIYTNSLRSKQGTQQG